MSKIWYFRPQNGRRFMTGELPTIAKLTETHVHVHTIPTENLEDAFSEMQSTRWSRTGEALIQKLGLTHTSMSVGDVVERNGEFYAVTYMGFKRLTE